MKVTNISGKIIGIADGKGGYIRILPGKSAEVDDALKVSVSVLVKAGTAKVEESAAGNGKKRRTKAAETAAETAAEATEE